MLNEKDDLTETPTESDDQDDQEERNTSADDSSTDAESTDDSSDDENTDTDSDDTTPDADDGLSEEERTREEQIRAELKRINDEKSQLGRERKRRREEIELERELTVQDADSTDDTTIQRPSRHWKLAYNEDGELEDHALMAEWNMYGLQVEAQKSKQLQSTIDELKGELSNFKSTDKQNKEFTDYQTKFGIDHNTYNEYLSIKENIGELDATEFLIIESKKVAALKAAEAQRQTETASMPPNGNAGAAVIPTRQNQQTVKDVVDDIKKVPRGELRIAKLQEVREKYPEEFASAVIYEVSQAGA